MTLKRNLIKKSLILFFLIVLLSVSFGAGFYYGKLQIPKPPSELPEEADISLLWKVWEVLEKEYIKPLDYQKMIYGAASGMVKSLGDPYTVFFDPEQTRVFKEDVSGRFEGVGMEIGIRKGQLTVIAPLENTPAQRAGVRSGDKIIKVNETFTKDITIEEAVILIRGPKGTEVSLMILRDEWDAPKEFKIKRAVIEIPSLKWELLALPNEAGGKEEKIAYVKLYHFSGNAHSDFKKAAFQILNSPAQKMILDLRDNPGGYLEVAQDIAGWFLEKGQIVTIEDFGKDKEKIEYKSNGNAMFLKYPLVVLINQGSASGSEILAAALRDNRGIKLIGERSFGKGLVQKPIDLKNGSSLKVTVAKWLTPNGKFIADVGLEPDIKIGISEEDYEQGRDPQLDKAIEIIKEMR